MLGLSDLHFDGPPEIRISSDPFACVSSARARATSPRRRYSAREIEVGKEGGRLELRRGLQVGQGIVETTRNQVGPPEVQRDGGIGRVERMGMGEQRRSRRSGGFLRRRWRRDCCEGPLAPGAAPARPVGGLAPPAGVALRRVGRSVMYGMRSAKSAHTLSSSRKTGTRTKVRRPSTARRPPSALARLACRRSAATPCVSGRATPRGPQRGEVEVAIVHQGREGHEIQHRRQGHAEPRQPKRTRARHSGRASTVSTSKPTMTTTAAATGASSHEPRSGTA